MNHFSVKPQTVMVNNISSHNNMNHTYVKHHYCFRGVIAVFHIAVVGHIVDHYFLMLDRRAVHIVVATYVKHKK
jgi:hypothetical protein